VSQPAGNDSHHGHRQKWPETPETDRQRHGPEHQELGEQVQRAIARVAMLAQIHGVESVE
jgi:hypothetical protein